MNGIILGVAILVSSGVTHPVETSRPIFAPAIVTFHLPDAIPTVRKLPPAKRFTKTDKVIAIAAGAVGGFIAGGYIGGAITENRDNPDDDMSVLRGILIGAPIGAVIGAIIGHKLTK